PPTCSPRLAATRSAFTPSGRLLVRSFCMLFDRSLPSLNRQLCSRVI
ncbi:hypothetical protein, partial [Pseudomonas aeruginosa]